MESTHEEPEADAPWPSRSDDDRTDPDDSDRDDGDRDEGDGGDQAADDEDGDDSRELSDVLDATVDVTDPGAEHLLCTGDIEILGRMPWSSNGTYLVTVTGAGEQRCQAIYKPASGERPLWDFPSGLWRREVAAWLVARQLGWPIVPPTVERHGPLGVGSLQFFVPSRFDEHYFTFKDDPAHRRALRQLCAFDLVSNNTDRKAGHILLSHTGRLWGIDHGHSFHEEFKLRTVMWDYAGEPIDTDLVEELGAWLDTVPAGPLADLLTTREIGAMVDRTTALIAAGRYPYDPTGRRYPWPLV